MERPIIGIVGAGQLALMMFEASLRMDLDIRVLATDADDPALRVVPGSRVGDPRDAAVLLAFASEVDVVTFDHELIDIASVRSLGVAGHAVRPGSAALAVAIDKARQHDTFSRLGIDQPPTVLVRTESELRAAMHRLALPVVVKHATGGYDGRGVHVVDHVQQFDRLVAGGVLGDGEFLVQPKVPIDAEVAVQVVRSIDGEILAYPVVRTIQEDGICTMVQLPAAIPDALARRATEVARLLADHLDVVGVLAVEFFVSGGRLLINEIAMRPHNSGHLTIEATVTSQFENHLRAVAGLPLGSTAAVVGAASMVNIIGSDSSPAPRPDRAPIDAAVHLYGKSHRPGRKLGHVTAVGDSIEDVVARARRAASALEPPGAGT